MQEKIKLNLGCGQDFKEGYINIDAVPHNDKTVVSDVRNLDYKEGSVDEIFAKDVIEHMPFKEAVITLHKWCSLLRRGGCIFIQTTCFDKICDAYKDGVWDISALNYMLFAGVNYLDGKPRDYDFHKSTYSEKFFRDFFGRFNMEIVSLEFEDIDQNLRSNPYFHNLNILVNARKV